jgi:chorismate synthase
MAGLRYLTAGESHGEQLTGILEGMPAGFHLNAARDIDPILQERQKGYGRGHRQTIEDDRAIITSGVRFDLTLGSPIAVTIKNRDWEHWYDRMSIEGDAPKDLKRVTVPRPGHADLAGAIKYDQTSDLRNILERASARETAMRTALGAIALKLRREIGVKHIGYVRAIGGISSSGDGPLMSEDFKNSRVRTFDPEAEERMIALIDQAKKEGDTLGGVVECKFFPVPVGIGSHVHWDRKLDAKLAEAVMSIQAVKAVEIGEGIKSSASFGSTAHDEIVKPLFNRTNNAGGIEGGMSNGSAIVVRAYMKPLSTLMEPLHSIDFATGEVVDAHIERSDVCAVPALSVIVEAVVGLTLASVILETFPSDTMEDLLVAVGMRMARSGIPSPGDFDTEASEDEAE